MAFWGQTDVLARINPTEVGPEPSEILERRKKRKRGIPRQHLTFPPVCKCLTCPQAKASAVRDAIFGQDLLAKVAVKTHEVVHVHSWKYTPKNSLKLGPFEQQNDSYSGVSPPCAKVCSFFHLRHFSSFGYVDSEEASGKARMAWKIWRANRNRRARSDWLSCPRKYCMDVSALSLQRPLARRGGGFKNLNRRENRRWIFFPIQQIGLGGGGGVFFCAEKNSVPIDLTKAVCWEKTVESKADRKAFRPLSRPLFSVTVLSWVLILLQFQATA